MDIAQLPNGIDSLNELLSALEKGGVKSIDTARFYGQSEELLGQVHASERFDIDTKLLGGFAPEPTTKQTAIECGELSLSLLQTKKVDVYYIHAPDRRSKLEDVLAGVDALYQAGKFNRFGLSNFLASEVDDVVRICRERGFVMPSVYQGNYSAVARRAETQILPTLRKYNISLYAYSPVAGGFLTKDVETILTKSKGRWDQSTLLGAMYHALYNKPEMLEGLKLWEKISLDTGIPKGELAYRWVTFNSALKSELGDGVIIGSQSLEQLTQTLAWIKGGALSLEVAAQVEQVWNIVEAVAPLDNFNDYGYKLK